MVYNRRDLGNAFSPNKVKRFAKRRLSITGSKPSTSGSTALGLKSENGSQTSIKVIVRVRPHNERELQNNCRTVVKIVDDKMLIFDPKEEENPFYYQGVVQKGRDLLKKQNKEQQFIFDTIFDMNSSNNDVFEGSTKDLIGTLLDGYNCSVFAYGATGAGKTHTMLGCENDPGITYRTVAELFSQIENQKEQRDFNLGVTYLEIYNENVQDLLHKSGPLHIRDDGRCGIIVAGLKIIAIHNADELLLLLARGNRNRTQHPTDANEESSRSHAVFQVYINITNKLDGLVRHVKLSMIDLAGSERASATGCKGARFKEGANINKSLLALGNCINNLADGIRHIPYRDSKLTRLLKDSLGGNCQTIMIANVSPTSFSFEDTYNTLRYATRAKKIKTNVKKNIVSCEMHVTGYIKMVEEQKKEINLLKQRLLTYENGTIQPVTETKSTPVKTELDKLSAEMCNKLINLFHRKKALNDKMLSLESSDKILCCRIQYKKAADERLHNLTATVDNMCPEEQNASGKTRLTKSLLYFNRQRDSLRTVMEATWKELRDTELEMQKINEEIKSKCLSTKVDDVLALRNCEIEKSISQQLFEHAKKVSSLQQCEMQSLNTIIKMLSTNLQNYYNMMRGYGTLTDKMKQEFKQLVKLLEGVRNIKWSDSEISTHEEDFYNLTCLSVPQLMDPLNNEVPVYTGLHIDEDEPVSQAVQNILSSTFDAADIEKVADVHNSTVTLDETPTLTMDPEYRDNLQKTGLVQENVSKAGILQENSKAGILQENGSKPGIIPENGSKPGIIQENGSKPGIIQESLLNNTFSLQEKAKKRVLSDKNNVSNRTPTKTMKKSTPTRKGGVAHINGPTGKENKGTPKHASGMSAKNMAILNKLKPQRLKLLPGVPKDGFDNQSDVALKAVRNKERRGLMNAHPYQKPSNKLKFAPAPPSSRVPW